MQSETEKHVKLQRAIRPHIECGITVVTSHFDEFGEAPLKVASQTSAPSYIKTVVVRYVIIRQC